MTPWAWLKFTIFLWLLRKTLKLTGWLLLAAVVIAAWPVTLVAAAGYLAAWLRGWPPVRLYRTAAWTLPGTAAWLAAVQARTPGWQPALGIPGRAWAHGWDHLAAPGLGHAFVLVVPVAVPAGLALGGLLWAWRIYAITTGLGGITASAPIIFDARQWNRQARTALGLTKAPGAVPLLDRGRNIPVGGTIRAIVTPTCLSACDVIESTTVATPWTMNLGVEAPTAIDFGMSAPTLIDTDRPPTTGKVHVYFSVSDTGRAAAVPAPRLPRPLPPWPLRKRERFSPLTSSCCFP